MADPKSFYYTLIDGVDEGDEIIIGDFLYEIVDINAMDGMMVVERVSDEYLTGDKMEYVMLTVNGKDVEKIPSFKCESVVKIVQDKVDEKAREMGLAYGELVSTRRIEDDK
tara:strand:+ start:3239 stop:3571 length:333 start_codon:yes stop_codon:yes gene_type:complete